MAPSGITSKNYDYKFDCQVDKPRFDRDKPIRQGIIQMVLPDFQEEKKLWRKDYKIVVGVDEVGRGSWAGPVVAVAVAFGFARGPVSLRPHPTSSSGFAGDAGARWGSSPALATPGCFSLDEILKLGINDSKALKSQKRTLLADKIRQCCLAWGLGEVGVGIINKVGIGKATERAMRKAIAELISNIKILNPKQIQNPNVQNSKSLEFSLPAGKAGISNLGFAKIFILVDGFHIRYLCGIGLKSQKAIIHGDQKSISISAASIIAKVYRDNLMRRLARKYPRYGWERSKGYGTKEHQKAILNYGLTRMHRKTFVGTFMKKRSGRMERNLPAGS